MLARGVGLVAAPLSLVLGVLTWLSSGDTFPPSISLSQYGLGPWGWLFSLWVLSLATAVQLLRRAAGTGGRAALVLAWVGTVGAVVMGVVRTDRGGDQQSWHAMVHMAGSVLTLVGLPLAAWLTARALGPWWRRSADLLIVISSGSLVLLLAAAIGWDSLGVGAHLTWARWQVVAVLAEQILVLTVAAGVLSTGDRPRPRPGGGGRSLGRNDSLTGDAVS